MSIEKKVTALRAVWNELNLTTAKPAAIAWAQRMAKAMDDLGIAAGVSTSSLQQQPGEWDEAQRIRDLPAVDEAIRNLLEDQTGDNSTCMVREVMRACGVSASHIDQPKDPK